MTLRMGSKPTASTGYSMQALPPQVGDRQVVDDRLGLGIMKRWVGFGVIILLVVGALVGAEFYVRGQVTQRFEDALSTHLDDVSGVAASPSGLVLPQLIQRRIGSADVTIESASLDGITLRSIDAQANGLSLDSPTTLEHITLTAQITENDLNSLAKDRGLPDFVSLRLVDGEVRAYLEVLGQELAVDVRVQAQGRSIGLELGEINAGPLGFDPSDFGMDINTLVTLPEISLEQLPQGMQLDDLAVTEVITLQASGTDVTL